MLYVLHMLIRGYNLLTISTSVGKNGIVAHVCGAAGADDRAQRLEIGLAGARQWPVGDGGVDPRHLGERQCPARMHDQLGGRHGRIGAQLQRAFSN